VDNKITPCHPRQVTWHSKMTWPMTWLPSGPIGHPVWPPPSGHPSSTPSGPVWPPLGHPVRPRLATPVWPPHLATPSSPVGHPVWPPLGTSSGRRRVEKKKKKKKIFFFWVFVVAGKEGKKYLGFKSPSSLSSPSSAGFAGEAARRSVFWPSSRSHPSELYSSLGWLNSKVPKPFFPFTLRLIDVDGF
jgi:hypothetical protein